MNKELLWSLLVNTIIIVIVVKYATFMQLLINMYWYAFSFKYAKKKHNKFRIYTLRNVDT